MFRLYDNWHEIENCKGYDQQKPCIIICQLCQKTATWAWTSCLAPLVLSVLIFEDKYLRTRLLRWHSGKEATCQCSRLKSSVQCSSGAQLCLTLCNPIHCSIPGLPVHHQLPEFTQTHVHWVGDAIQPSHSVILFSSHLQSFPASGSFQMSQFFASSGQNIGVSTSASVLPMNIQDWFPLVWTGWISFLSKGLPRVFSNTTVQKHQFFSAQLSL